MVGDKSFWLRVNQPARRRWRWALGNYPPTHNISDLEIFQGTLQMIYSHVLHTSFSSLCDSLKSAPNTYLFSFISRWGGVMGHPYLRRCARQKILFLSYGLKLAWMNFWDIWCFLYKEKNVWLYHVHGADNVWIRWHSICAFNISCSSVNLMFYSFGKSIGIFDFRYFITSYQWVKII